MMIDIIRNGRRIPLGTAILLVLVAVGLAAGLSRFILGLGATTNLSDVYPWGLWIAFDVMCGVALAAGAFTVAAIVHVFNLELYKPVLRPAIVTGFLGYLLVIMGLLADLGRPYRIWHLIIYWNPHSVLFEVGTCVMLYTTVMILELAPLLFERLNRPKALRIIQKVTIPLVIAGVALSTMHQSSLGSLFLIMPDKLHPLWFSPMLPAFFCVSAIAVGLAMVILESSISAKVFRRNLETDAQYGLAGTLAYILGFYLVFKLGELLVTNELRFMFEGSLESRLFALEVLGGVALPMILLAYPPIRRSRSGLLWGSILVIGGVVLNRINVSIVGPQVPAGARYFPHWMEIAITLGLVSAGIVAFMLAVRFLHVLPEPDAGLEWDGE
jgi:Ni/Fe-hydrogenase subunit HybB-like protein